MKINHFTNVEYRSSDNDERSIEGFASVFNQETDIGWFYEKIDEHAFDECDMSDVYLLMNHDPNLILAGTQNNSLELSVQDKGLFQRATIVNTTQGNDYLQLVKEGLIRKMSFGFTIDRDNGCEWYEDENGNEHRIIKKIDRLFDVSIVTYPAYDGTSVRSMDELDEDAKKHFEEKRKMEIKEEVIEETRTEETEEVEEVVENSIVEENHEEKNDDVQMEEERMNTNFENVETRSEDIKAWRDHIMAGVETRALTTQDEGMPIPTIFADYIARAWERVDLLDEVTKTAIRGYFNVSYEASSTGAVLHEEGSEAPAEEELVLGTIQLIPAYLKKWISVTDELQSMTDDQFMKYVADEVVYNVLKKLKSEILVGNTSFIVGIENATLTEEVESTLDFNAINKALAEIDGGENPLVVMNRKTFFNEFMGLTDTTGRPIYNIVSDNAGRPMYFVNGIRVMFADVLPTFDDAGTSQAWAIVGDFKAYHLNMPNGENVETLFDPYTLATQDKSRIIGKLFVAGNVTKPKALAKIVKPV